MTKEGRPEPFDEQSAGTPAPARRRISIRDVLRSLTVAGAVVAGALATGWPERPLQWVMLAIAALLAALSPHLAWSGGIRERGRRMLRQLRPRWLRTLLMGALALAVAATAGWLLSVATDARANSSSSATPVVPAMPASLKPAVYAHSEPHLRHHGLHHYRATV